MNVAQLFFSFNGRINRAKYWLGILIFIVISLFMGALVRLAEGLLAIELMSIAVHMALMVAGLGLGAKRLHDRNKSAWWLLLFYVLPGMLFMIGALMFFHGMGSDSADGMIGGVAFVAIALVVALWAFVQFGVLRGTAGPNRFGPDPLAAEP